MKLYSALITFLLFSLSVYSKPIVIPAPPTFGNTGAITICVNGSYYLNPSTTNGTFSTLSSTIATVNASGYVTGVSVGTTIVSFVATVGGTVTATVTVGSSPGLSITDPLAQASYKFNNNPQGPTGGLNNYVGYNGYNYSSQARPSNTGFFRASNQSGNAAGCPYEYYIFRCTTCGTVPEYATRPQGTLTGNTILPGSTGQLTYTSSNSPAGGPFTIVYLPNGGSNITVNNISSTVAFNVALGTPTSTTSYTLISVTDESTNSSTDFSGTTATINYNPIYTIGQSALGGKIAYILQEGDFGYDPNVQHGLVATAADISTGAEWGCVSTDISGVGEVLVIGTGNQNTIKIMAGCPTAGIAARLCGDLVEGGYSDWYLPSHEELNKLYENRVAFNGFANAMYWSSTQAYNIFALAIDFNDYQAHGCITKDTPARVRAIRAF